MSHYILTLSPTFQKTDDSDNEDEDGGAPTPRTTASFATLPSSTVDILSDPEDDVTLRAAIYGVLFQAYADQVILTIDF